MAVSVEVAPASRAGVPSTSVFLDLDTVLISAHQGRRGIELGAQADVREGIDRLSQVVDGVVVLVFPPTASARVLPDEQRLEVLRAALGGSLDGLLVAACPHGGHACDCAKPGSELIELAVAANGPSAHGGWFIGADQEGVQSGRGAGLRTIRIGPLGTDHLSSVHRPDYEARDLLDAANHILVEELA